MINIVFLGCSGFPVGFAQVQKQLMLARGLSASGARVLVVSNRATLKAGDAASVHARGRFMGIPYVFTSFVRKRPDNFVIRNFVRLFGKFNEFILLVAFAVTRRNRIAVLSTLDTSSLRYYHIVCGVLRIKTVLIYDELVSTHGRGSPAAASFDKLVKKNCDALLPISNYLKSFQEKLGNTRPMFLVSALTDYDLINSIKQPPKEPLLLFCGHACYYETIRLIILSFEKIAEFQLELIIHGKPDETKAVREMAEKSVRHADIRITGPLPYPQLIQKYKAATLLLAPLLDTDRDKARFPHKISEYCASGTPFVTTDIGDISMYFTHGTNAFIAPAAEPGAFAATISEAIARSTNFTNVSAAAFATGSLYFDYRKAGKSLFDFFEKTVLKSGKN